MSNFGTVSAHGGHAAVRFERRYEARPEEVWAALTKPAAMGRWLGAEVTIQPEIGGTVLLRWPGGEAMTGSVLRCDPPRLLEYSWKESGEEIDSVVTFEIAPAGPGTILVLEHRRIDPGSVVGFGAGWHGHLDALGALLAGHSYDLDGSYQRLRPVYEARLANNAAS
jgi:uncharacterized protein YndB with AHSA1/START domain